MTKVGTVSYEYDDNNGNLTSDSTGREFFYTSFDKPSLIKNTGSNDQTAFFYGPDRSRYKRIDTRANGEVITTLYLGNVERIHRSSDGKYRWKRYLPGGGVFTYTTDADFNQQSFTEQYLLKDHIGSTDVVLDANGNILETMAFDPWGKRRDADWQAIDISDLVASNYSLLDSLTDTTTKGFTGHEMVDALGVIHMNGRIYDPELGRFLQADPFIDGVGDTQGYNRYSYVKGNPLTLTDPTGYYSWGDLVDDVKGFLKDLCGDSCGVNVDSNGNIDLYAGQPNPDHGGFWAQPGAAGISTPEGTVPGAFGESKREGESIWDLITSQGTSENGGGFDFELAVESLVHLEVDGQSGGSFNDPSISTTDRNHSDLSKEERLAFDKALIDAWADNDLSRGFDSQNAAAEAWANAMNPVSMEFNLEVGSNIYFSKESGQYFVAGLATTYQTNAIKQAAFDSIRRPSAGYKLSAYIHTHSRSGEYAETFLAALGDGVMAIEAGKVI
ncbi:RHS repeat domain-containing protein [Microbulbifer thermotolerans]|uniref:RHS repeat domain-containing protein n=1 Tax=Microbulbifer thermotolerans TaxID=252514 RepID=UPI0022497B07|nr:RHS repeat-associated core domain-containing protein [Microbulbifer thermotolerans]MCX2832331.1 RHS repeat-associated core domain-containing protein [Microbulbifer thermotolerans]